MTRGSSVRHPSPPSRAVNRYGIRCQHSYDPTPFLNSTQHAEVRGLLVRIFDYAKVAHFEERLADLASIAEPERWTYERVPEPRTALPVLESYVRFTFHRVAEQQKLAVNNDVSCFNTGLLTPGQEEIFGIFSRSNQYDPAQPAGATNKQWFLASWARGGDRVMGKFARLPALASYWDDPADLIFNPALVVQANIDHILRDNINRFPQEYGGAVDDYGVPRDLLQTPDIEDEGNASAAVEANEEATVEIPLAARNILDGAIKHSVRLAQRSYRVAVPQFHRGTIQLLLPLYLRDKDRADLALTLEKQGDWYRAATVLYPDWAYRHARLLSRPNSEWLGGFITPMVT